MLSLSLVLDVEASLNLYSDLVRGLTARSKTMAMMLATYGTLYVGWVVARERAANLETALINSRRIGMTVGVLMAARKLRDGDAFDLRTASQTTNRRMVLVADEVIETGTLERADSRTGDGNPALQLVNEASGGFLGHSSSRTVRGSIVRMASPCVTSSIDMSWLKA